MTRFIPDASIQAGRFDRQLTPTRGRVPQLLRQGAIKIPKLGVEVARKPAAPVKARSNVQKVLDAIQTPLFATVGVTKEFKRRAEGLPALPIKRAVITQIQRRKGFSDIVGNPLIGFGLDVVFDPLNLLAVGPLSKALKIPKAISFVGRKISPLIESRPSIAIVKNALGRAFNVKFGLPNDVLKLKNKFLRKSEAEATRLGAAVAKKLALLEPNEISRKKVFDLIERSGIKFQGVEGQRQLQAFKAEFSFLSKSEKSLFNAAKEVIGDLEKMKLSAGLITREQLANFALKFNIQWVPHRMATREFNIARLLEMKDSLKRGENLFKATTDLKTIDFWIEEFKNMNVVIDPAQRQRMFNFARGNIKGLFPSFMFRRTRPGTAKSLAKVINKEIELDIANVLGMETRDVARAVASRQYVLEMEKFLEKKSLAIPTALTNSPEKVLKLFSKEFGSTEARKIVNRGFEEISEGLSAPREIAAEIKRVMRAYRNPKVIEDFANVYVTWQRVWKAWTLSIFPAYHTRNVVSNLWNNFLAGMDIRALPDYKISAHMILQSKLGKLPEGRVIGKYTYKQLWEGAEDFRVVKAGQLAGEAGDTIAHRATVEAVGISGKLVDIPIIRTGFKVGSMLEDHARLAHFLWRIRKGDTMEQAAKSVQKFLFDYKFGLTSFETKVLRDGLIPFWAWTRFNLPLQLEMMVMQPQKLAGFGKFKRAFEDQFGGPEPQEMFLADWMKRALKIRWRFDKKTGNYQYFVLSSWWPTADVQKLMGRKEIAKEITSLLSPFVKVPVELLFNYNLFIKRKVSEFRGQTRKIAGVSLPARIEHMVRNIRLLNEVDRELELINKDLYVESVIRPFLGKSYPVDFKRQKKIWDLLMSKRVGMAKRARSIELNRIKRGRGSTKNVDRLDKIINELTERRKEFL